MKYLMLVCVDPAVQLSPEEREAMRVDTDAWVAEMDARGVRLQGTPLRPVSEAVTVRVRDGQVHLSDGPFAVTAEQVGGFDLLECSDRDEAVEVASRHPVARIGAIEVRAFWE
jgi:hypothetical protein